MAVDYEWRLRVLMAENGMFKAIDLAPRLAEHGIRLSDSQVWRLVTGRPERLNLRLLIVLCEILGCEPGELVKRTDVAAVAEKDPASGRQIRKDLKPKQVGSSARRAGRDGAAPAGGATCVRSLRRDTPDPYPRARRPPGHVPALRAANGYLRRLRTGLQDGAYSDRGPAGGRALLLQAARRHVLAVRRAAAVPSRRH
jgi:DNA-binding Xre family transcriptional regulator